MKKRSQIIAFAECRHNINKVFATSHTPERLFGCFSNVLRNYITNKDKDRKGSTQRESLATQKLDNFECVPKLMSNA